MAESFTFFSLILLAEVTTARLFAVKCIHSHQTTNLDEVSQTESFLQFVIECTSFARDIDICPELFLDSIYLSDSGFESFGCTSHTNEVPHDKTQLFVDAIHRAFTLNLHQAVNLLLYFLLCFSELRQVGGHTRYADLVAEVVLNGIRKYKVTISQTLHQSRSAETVSSVVGEVSLTDTEQTLNGSLQFIVNPDTTHCVVDSREDHHRVLIRVLVNDFLVHLEQVTIFLCNYILAETLDSVGEIKEYSQTGIVYAIAFVATLFRSARSDVTGNEVTESRIATLQIVIAVFFRNITSFDFTGLETFSIFEFLRNPDTTVVTERLRHQCQFGLEVTVLRNTSRVNLRVAWVSEVCAVAIHLHRSRTVRSHRIGREEEGISVTTGSYNNCVCKEALNTSSNKVTSDDTTSTRFAILVLDHNDIKHLVAVIHLHFAFTDLAAECRISAEEELLSCLAFCIESTANLCATE